MTVIESELNWFTAYVFQETERRADLDCIQARVSREYVAHLVEGQACRAYRKTSYRRSRKVTVGLTIYGKEPLQGDARVDEPAIDGNGEGAHPSRSRSARTSRAASMGPLHLRESPSSSLSTASRSRRSSPISRRAPVCRMALRLVWRRLASASRAFSRSSGSETITFAMKEKYSLVAILLPDRLPLVQDRPCAERFERRAGHAL